MTRSSVTSFRFIRKAGVDALPFARTAWPNTARLGVWFSLGAGHAGHDSGLWKRAALADPGAERGQCRRAGDIAAQTVQWNETNSLLHAAAVEEYRMRFILRDIDEVVGSSGGCNKSTTSSDPQKWMRCTSTCAASIWTPCSATRMTSCCSTA